MSTEPPHILVVDDNPDDRTLVVRTLSQEFPEAKIDDTVRDEETFVKRMQAGEFNCVVSDFQLQWSDGLRILCDVRRKYPDCPVVFFTATGSEEVAVEGMKQGLDDYVLKSPSHFVRLPVAVRWAVDKRRYLKNRRQLEDDLVRAKERAEAAGRLKDDFLAAVSEEMRTPLQAILGWSSLLRRRTDLPPEAQSALEIIEDNARIQTQIVNELLDTARLITGRMRLEVQRIDMDKVIEAALISCTPAFEAKRLQVRKIVEPGVGSVMGDPNRLQQACWNILANAAKFTPAGGRVDIELRRSGECVELTITDSGRGIEPSLLPNVFDAFRQFEPDQMRPFGGLGVGLSIVKSIVDLHGGQVRAASRGVNEGAKFTITLPAQLTAETSEGVPSVSGASPWEFSPTTLESVRILVVNDDADAIGLLSRILKESGARVDTADQADQAIALFEAFRPDVLICDIGLSGEDGYSLIRRVRASERAAGSTPVPAIALSAYTRPEERKRAMLAGYQFQISKPVDAGELVATVANLAELSGRPVTRPAPSGNPSKSAQSPARNLPTPLGIG